MSSYADIEGLLTAAPRLVVVPGSHQEDLRRRLLRQARGDRSVTMPLFRWKMVLLSTGCAAAVFLVVKTALWYFTPSVLPQGDRPYELLTFPDGGMVLSSDPGYSVTKATGYYEEVRDLLGRGKGTLLRRIDVEGEPSVLVYQVTLSDGETVYYSQAVPMPDREDRQVHWVLWVGLPQP